jgi:hypothetical protein
VTFYLGTHMVNWLGTVDVPLFVSNRRLHKRKKFPRALAPWCLDSGGFSELSLYGKWVTTAEEYAERVETYFYRIGKMEWAAPQDWMCEPIMLEKTGKTVEEHQHLTIESYLELKRLNPVMPFIPVLQGWYLEDYLRHVYMYAQYGVDLTECPTVGLGSVCRRQHTEQITEIVSQLDAFGLNLHGFGVKTQGLKHYGPMLQSADSMAWSYDARYVPPMEGHTHKNCANCPDYALMWRERMLSRLPTQRVGVAQTP